MATQTLFSLAQATLAAIERRGHELVLRFDPAFVYVALTGSDEQTEWRQAGELLIEEAEIEGELPSCPCSVRTGDYQDNGYVYRDLVPLPVDSGGQVGIAFACDDATTKVTVHGTRARLLLAGERKYVRHVRK